ncbi:MAG: glycerol-3-phosphate 1-O-acyltransferase PlsY [Mariprofundaceae bacterium]|nr:glycerol-3-phosphate 1-O-acyltransferase PlsY [Mariprofundaceae bacterium]
MGIFQAPEIAAAAIVSAYLLGAIPFGLLFARWLTGKDPRKYGSGNIGATNALRTSGKKVGVLTLLSDIGKGALAVGLAQYLQSDMTLVAAVALAVFLGHVFPIYLKFKGGKGVATMFGVLIPWLPWVGISAFAVWLLLFKLSRYVSLASVVAALMLPAFAWLFDALSWFKVTPSSLFTCVILALLVAVRHQENMRRLWAGEEPKIGSANKL